MVRSSGFEPPRSCERQPLKLVRLPVPPRPQCNEAIEEIVTEATTCLEQGSVVRSSEQEPAAQEQALPASARVEQALVPVSAEPVSREPFQTAASLPKSSQYLYRS